jgi:Protein of unknown function (DUF2934)
MGNAVMTSKTVRSTGSKPQKGATNAILSTSSVGKVQSKPEAGPKPNSHLPGSAGYVSAQKRGVMIAEAAYYIAERRGFEAGREMEDWLLAEKQVDAVLSSEKPPARA